MSGIKQETKLGYGHITSCSDTNITVLLKWLGSIFTIKVSNQSI